MTDFLGEYGRLLRRLERSDTPQKRKNARKAMRLLLRGEDRRLDREYPLLLKNGRPKPKKTTPVCPVCRVPFKTWAAFARHCVRRHFGQTVPYEFECWCGATFCARAHTYTPVLAQESCIRSFAQHLRSVPDLKAHVVTGTLKNLP